MGTEHTLLVRNDLSSLPSVIEDSTFLHHIHNISFIDPRKVVCDDDHLVPSA